MRLFSRAVAVVGVHGAGLSNCLFASRGALLIELVPREPCYRDYQHLSAALGLRYAAVPLARGVYEAPAFRAPARRAAAALREGLLVFRATRSNPEKPSVGTVVMPREAA